jgi:hypothetical protein
MSRRHQHNGKREKKERNQGASLIYYKEIKTSNKAVSSG